MSSDDDAHEPDDRSEPATTTGSSTASAPTLYRLDAEQSTADYLRDMWNRRDFAVALPLEQLKVAHQDRLLGNIWHLFNPLLSGAVYYVIFGVILDTSRNIDHFVMWLMIGVFSYQLTTTAVVQGARSITGNVGLMRALRFPRALLPISSVLSGLMQFGFQWLILAGGAIISGVGLSSRWFLIPLILVLQTMLNLGLAFIVARMNDLFPDVEQVVPFVFRLLMYASGVMFPVRAFVGPDSPQYVRLIVEWNPILHILEMYRWAVLGTPVEVVGVVHASLVSVVVLIVGFRFFRAGEDRYGLR